MESVSLRSYSDAYPCHRVPTHGLISVIPAMLMKKSCYHVTFVGFCFEFGCATSLVILATPFVSSTDCKRVALVPIITDAAPLQSALDSKTGSRILPNGSRSQIQNKTPRRSRDSMTSLTWQIYGPGVGAHNYGYSRRILAQSVLIDS